MSHFGIAGTRSSRIVSRTAVIVAALVLSLFAQSALATNPPSPPPLNFENNYFVTGDYVVGGVGLRGRGVNGVATGTITIPDPNQPNAGRVPPGADIVAAFLYWQTTESVLNKFAGQLGYFNGYPIAGTVLGNPNSPVSWGLGGCTGWFPLFKTIRSYRADVRSYLKMDAGGTITGEVRLKDSGFYGLVAPSTLGATLVVIYRVVDKNVPLNSIVIYDGAFAPIDSKHNMSLGMQGFHEAAAGPVAKITHIVGNGAPYKYEKVYLKNDKTGSATLLPSLYGSAPSFPGIYNGSWDNPTWVVSNAVNAEDSSETTYVDPDCGCVSWSAVIFSTTVQDSDNDGLLDKWETDGGYCDAAVNNGSCSHLPGDPGWVPLPDANPLKRDVYVEADYMSQGGVSYYPDNISGGQPVAMVTNAFNNQNINLHVIPGNAIPFPTCTDSVSPPNLCQFPNQPGVVGWKGGFEFLKNQPLNYPDEASCEAALNGPCMRRFQHGKKDSYHYMIFGYGAGAASWSLQDGSLTSVVVDNSGVATFYTSTAPSKLNPLAQPGDGYGRITVGDAITNPNLNGTWLVTSKNVTTAPYSFTVQTSNVPAGTYDKNSDPNLSVAMGQAGTSSGVSDIGGQDSLVALGSWGNAGTSVNVQAGTFMHELGHALGLTHGGYYYKNYGVGPNHDYTPSFEGNCKSNYLSIMNYFFQVDLLGPNNDGLDYSSQQLSTLDETNLSGGVTTTDGSFTAFSTTKWYDTTKPAVGNAAAAQSHCDGTPIAQGEPSTYRYEGPSPAPLNPTSTIPITWSANSLDINFDGHETSLQGFDDWHSLDLRQVGATGNASVAGGILLGGSGGILLGGSGGISLGGSGGIVLGGSGGILLGGSGGISLGGSGGISLGGSGGISLGGSGGIGQGEITPEVANSVVRPPRNFSPHPTDTRMSHSVSLSWLAPIFGQIGSYNVYRADTPPGWPKSVAGTAYTDPAPGDPALTDCMTYTYSATSVLAADLRESVPSNTATYSVPCRPTGLTATQSVANNMGSVILNWTAASTASGANYGYNVYRDNGAAPLATVLASDPTPTSYNDTTVTDNATHTYYVTTVLADRTGCMGGQYCRESTQVSVPIDVSFHTKTTITSVISSPSSILAQSVTVSFTVSRVYGQGQQPSGSVTVSDGSASCSGTGSCALTLTVVGWRTLTATYPGDSSFFGSSSAPAQNIQQQVIYKFTGFLSPLKAAGSGSNSGSFEDDIIPIKWQLQDYSGKYISDLTVNTLKALFTPLPKSKVCPAPSAFPAPSKVTTLYSASTGVAPHTSFSYNATSHQFASNWNTEYFDLGCYVIELDLNDGTVQRTAMRVYEQ